MNAPGPGRVSALLDPRRAARPAHGFYRGGHLRIVSAGVITRHAQKGMDLIIRAAAELRASGRDDFSVDLYGRIGDHSFQAEVQRLGLERHVTLKGVLPQAELMDRFGSYDLFAFPTWDREPFGMAPLEALSRGCVPVLSRVCGISEWLVEGVHCLKADRDADAFAAAWAEVLDGRVALEPLARRGLRRGLARLPRRGGPGPDRGPPLRRRLRGPPRRRQPRRRLPPGPAGREAHAIAGGRVRRLTRGGRPSAVRTQRSAGGEYSPWCHAHVFMVMPRAPGRPGHTRTAHGHEDVAMPPAAERAGPLAAERAETLEAGSRGPRGRNL